jgi:hypothetical protein
MDMVKNTYSNKDYIDSGKWKCNKSPGGAHHWIIRYDQMTCKYCREIRQILVTSQSETPSN